jgi:chromate transporter
MSLLAFAALVLAFTTMGMGNGPAMIPFFQRSLVEEQQVLTVEQMLFALAISQVTPGQGNLFVTSIGYMLFGLPGALLSTAVLVLPAYTVLPLMRGYERIKQNKVMRGLVRGMTCASVGLILAATVELGRSSLTQPVGWAAFVLTLGLTQVVKWRPLPSLVTASCAGMLLLICSGR